MKTVTKTPDSQFSGKKTLTEGKSIAKSSDTLYKGSFADLPDRTIYWDPQGFMKGKSIDMKSQMWDRWQETGVADEIDRLQKEENYPFATALDTVSKNYDTTDWSIPIFHIPEIRVSQPELTPIADNIPRVTVDSDTVIATEETDQPEPSFGLETTDDTEGSYSYADGSYTDHEYDVVGYGIASRLEDKMVLASDALRATQSVAEQAHANGIRQIEERQILLGTENDANGFDGMKDLGTEEDNIDVSTPEDVNWKEEVRQLITELEFQGANRSNIVIAVDFDTFTYIQNDLETEVRYNDPGEELGFGFQVLQFDGVQIWKTNALTRLDTLTSGDQETLMVGADMGSNYMGMLQDMTVKPLAKVAPQEQFATDVYGTFVSEAPSHIQYVDGNVP